MTNFPLPVVQDKSRGPSGPDNNNNQAQYFHSNHGSIRFRYTQSFGLHSLISFWKRGAERERERVPATITFYLGDI